MHELLNRPVLPVGTDSLLAMAPQVIHRVQFGTSNRQPNQSDPRAPCVASRGLGRMGTVPVQDQRHTPSPILLMDQPEEFLEVFFPLLLPLQEQPCPVGGVEGTEEHPLGVASAQRDLGVLPAPRQQARKGGNSSRSVSSWNRTTARGPNPLIYRRIRRIFAARSGSGSRTSRGRFQTKPKACNWRRSVTSQNPVNPQ